MSAGLGKRRGNETADAADIVPRRCSESASVAYTNTAPHPTVNIQLFLKKEPSRINVAIRGKEKDNVCNAANIDAGSSGFDVAPDDKYARL